MPSSHSLSDSSTLPHDPAQQSRGAPARTTGTPDPRQTPVLRVDRHLPPPSPGRLQAGALRAHFAQARDGWLPELQAEPRFTDKPMAPASVLIALVQRDTGLQVLLTQRSARLSSHAGQISFPGGKADPQDHDAVACALRETWEEIGLPAHHIEVLGSLPLYRTGSAYAVTPVVALLPAHIEAVANPQEVAEVFEVPLAFLMNPAHHRHHQVHWGGVQRNWLSMPYRDAAGVERFIWGATAGMLRNLYRYLLLD